MGKLLYVTNISFEATEDDLRTMFSVAGTVRSIKLLTDPQSGKFRGCGFVEMSSDAEAKEAVNSLDEVIMIDRLLTVVIARPSKPKEIPDVVGQKARKRVFGERSKAKDQPSSDARRGVKSGSGFGASEGGKPKGRPSGSAQRAVKAGSGFGASAGAKPRGRSSASGAATLKPGRSGRPGKGRK